MSELRATIGLPDEVVEALVEQVLKRLEVRRVPDGGSDWLFRAAASYLGWPTARVYKRIRMLPHCRDGNVLMFRRSELDAYLDERYEGPPRPAPPTLPPPGRPRGRSTGVPGAREGA
jgi:hypothetical protein